MEKVELLVVGGGAAGIAAARAAFEAGCPRVLLVDSLSTLGGVLRQCAHEGFGPGLTGPQYVDKLLDGFPAGVTVWTNASVLSLSPRREARIVGPELGERIVRFDRLILATGCREIPLGALPIAGTRPRGVYTAGQMQELMNLQGRVPPGPVLILGSGDLGLIMAQQIAGLGIPVTMIEKKESCGGLARNRRCLEQYPIRLYCGVTIDRLVGERELRAAVLSDGRTLPCRSLLIAVGLTPERELIRGLGQPEWLTLCGNCRSVHAMVEGVVGEGEQAGIHVWKRLCSAVPDGEDCILSLVDGQVCGK